MGLKPRTKNEVRRARADMRRFALGLPGAHEDFPWGERVIKVKGKVFAFLGRESTDELGFSVKLPHSGADVLSMPFAEPTGYGLGKSGWVSLRFAAQEIPANEVLFDWLMESYRAVAPKTLAAQVSSGVT